MNPNSWIRPVRTWRSARRCTFLSYWWNGNKFLGFHHAVGQKLGGDGLRRRPLLHARGGVDWRWTAGGGPRPRPRAPVASGDWLRCRHRTGFSLVGHLRSFCCVLAQLKYMNLTRYGRIIDVPDGAETGDQHGRYFADRITPSRAPCGYTAWWWSNWHDPRSLLDHVKTGAPRSRNATRGHGGSQCRTYLAGQDRRVEPPS